MFRCRYLAQVLLSACLLGVFPLSAANIVFDAADSGWYRSTDGFHEPTNENFFVGADPNAAAEFRNFSLFDLSSQVVPGSVLSVTLRVENVPLNDTAGSPQGGETYSVYEVLSSAASVTSGGAGVFPDLADGTLYGSLSGLSADVAQTIDVDFNGGGVGAVTSALVTPGLFVVGGAITSIDDPTFLTDGEDFFEGPNVFNVGATTRQLIIHTDAVVVPEPSTILLVGAGLLGLLGRARRRLV
jgi:PEP-CTERM motif